MPVIKSDYWKEPRPPTIVAKAHCLAVRRGDQSKLLFLDIGSTTICVDNFPDFIKRMTALYVIGLAEQAKDKAR